METRTASSATISEVLNVDNYLVWSAQVKTYLIARDLWDIVEGTDKCPEQKDDEVAFKAWTRKNAMALHEIQMSCSQRIRSVISRITSAKIAWETLEEICSIPKSDYVVPEETEERYEAWSNRMNKILRKHNLWEIVETTNKPATDAWSKKNALALHLIRESCGSDRFSLIEKISKAKDAWKKIEFKPGSYMIVLDDVDEYKDWSLQVKTKLKREQLWDIVEGTDEPPKVEKNAMALQVIKDSCINAMQCAIEKTSSAKMAWDILAGICALPKTAFEFLAQDGSNYLDWSLQVKAILMDRQLWDIVEGNDDPPKAEKNDMALGLIRYSCFSYRIELGYNLGISKLGMGKLGIDKLESITSAKILWDALAAICALPKNKESNAIVIEHLDSYPAIIKRLDDVDNYKDWSLQVKAYLTNQKLWDIVEGTNEPPENDEALAVIMFSCGYHLRFAIWGITSAKVAWDALAEICKIPKSSYIVPEESDYGAWRSRMEAILKAYVLWDIIEAPTEPPKPEDEEIAFNAWSKKNAIALYLIWESSAAFFSFKKSTRTAQIAWDTLAAFGNSGEEGDQEQGEPVDIETKAKTQPSSSKGHGKMSQASSSSAVPPDAFQITPEVINGLQDTQNKQYSMLVAIQEQMNILSAKFDKFTPSTNP